MNRAEIRRHLSLVVKRQWPLWRPRRVILSTHDWMREESCSLGAFARNWGPWYRSVCDQECDALPARGPINAVTGTRLSATGRHSFDTGLFFSHPESGFYYLPKSSVFSEHGIVLSNRSEIFNEFAHGWSSNERSAPAYSSPFATFSVRPRVVSGVHAVLSVEGSASHYHWLLQLLPRIHLLSDIKDYIDFFIVPSTMSATQEECLRFLGIGSEKLVRLGRGEKIYCDKLFVPTIPQAYGALPRWVISFLRAVFGVRDEGGFDPHSDVPAISDGVRRTRQPCSSESHGESLSRAMSVESERGSVSGVGNTRVGLRKLFLARSPTGLRAIENEMEVRDLMVRNGYEIVDGAGLTILDQARLMAQARVVVGAHGAALTNLVFATNAKVLEIFAPSFTPYETFYSLSHKLGHEYWWMIADESDEPEFACRICLQELQLAIDRIEASAASGSVC